jgi:terminase small subunit / prophage DNA-packing protein
MTAPKPEPNAAGQPVETIARVLGISARRVQQLVKEGMPQISRGRYPLIGCVQWYIKYWQDRAEARASDTLSFDAVRTRKVAAEAELAEIDLARARGIVVPAPQVAAAAEEEVLRFRTAVQQMSSSEAPLVAQRLNCSHREASKVLREVADRVLSGLAADETVEEDAA